MPVVRREGVGSMRKAGGLEGEGEGEGEGTSFPQNSTDQNFKIQLPINKIKPPTNKIQQIRTLKFNRSEL